MQMTVEISEKDLVAFGEESLRQEVAKMVKQMRLRRRFRDVSAELQAYSDDEYQQMLEEVRQEAWDEYGQGFTVAMDERC